MVAPGIGIPDIPQHSLVSLPLGFCSGEQEKEKQLEIRSISRGSSQRIMRICIIAMVICTVPN